jgi:hypothetical protein
VLCLEGAKKATYLEFFYKDLWFDKGRENQPNFIDDDNGLLFCFLFLLWSYFNSLPLAHQRRGKRKIKEDQHFLVALLVLDNSCYTERVSSKQYLYTRKSTRTKNASLNCRLHTVKKAFRYSRPQPVCHEPNSP